MGLLKIIAARFRFGILRACCNRRFFKIMNLGQFHHRRVCQTKCTYCNFHTGVVAAGRYAPYSAAVCTEIQQRGALWGAAGVCIPESAALVDTVYIGEGHQVSEPALLTTILDTIRAQFPCAFRELTLEADPETVDAHKAANWVAAGINRISFGAQSFIDDELKAAGRMHRRMDIHESSKILRAAGVRISVSI